MNAQDVEAVREALSRGAHKGGHHPRCATRHDDEGCDCYARHTYPARAAFARIVADKERLQEAGQKVLDYSELEDDAHLQDALDYLRAALAEEKP